ncbi:MAG: YcgN family cysteine cluster protein [SAR324 cluster bacterium]|nr:YcgN family cysteine cluster protein [SAR324 cluster bacterium]
MARLPGKTSFWKTKALAEMDHEEWESLCDGCGRCCVHKLEDETSGEVHYTKIACRLLDITRCRCQSYQSRYDLVPTCTVVTLENIEKFQWLPVTCAYRLLAEGKDLEWWHPLVSGDPKSIHHTGISVQDKVIPEQNVDPENWEDYLI